MQRACGRLICCGFLVVLWLPAMASAQAWLPPKGEGSVSITYQGLFSRDHLDRKGDPFDRGRVSGSSLLTGIEYGISDRVAIDAKIAVVANKHEGTQARRSGPSPTA